MIIERVSVEVTRRCGKACWFCYNGSAPSENSSWTADELVAFAEDCAKNGVKAMSFGGGEPTLFEGFFEVIARLKGTLFRSFTTNGLGLEMDPVLAAAPDKVHVSIHFPDRQSEVDRVIAQVKELESVGIRSGVNLLVQQSLLGHAKNAAAQLHQAGIKNDRIVFLPMRGKDTPTPDELGQVAGGKNFQSMTCLFECGKSPRFCSVGADKTVAWCSYTVERNRMSAPTHAAMLAALPGGVTFCGEDNLVKWKKSSPAGQARQ